MTTAEPSGITAFIATIHFKKFSLLSVNRTLIIIFLFCLTQLNASALAGQNDAPFLDNTLALSFSVMTNSGAPVGAVGVSVGMFTGGITDVDNTDGDGPALKGIALIATDATNGTWYYSTNNGTTWTLLGAPTTSTSRLLADNGTTRIYFQPNTNFTGTVSSGLTFRAWDQSSGTNGSTASTAVTGGTSAFSTATDVISVTVAVNNAPVLDASKSPALNSVNEDAPAPVGAVGTLVSSLVDAAVPAGGMDNVTDVDAGALYGIAIIATNASIGTLYYTLDNGAIWSPAGSVSDAAALLLAANSSTRLYFQPLPNLNGTFSSALTFRAWDQTSGTSGSISSTTSNGGATAFSAATDVVSLTVNAVNHAPTSTAPATATLTEDVQAAVTGVSVGDVDNTTLTITLSVSAGTLTMTSLTGILFIEGDGTNDATMTASGTIANLNNALASLFVTPAPNFNGAFSITFSVTDGIAAPVLKTISGTVIPVNDAPVLDASQLPALNTLFEDASAPSGAVGSLVSNLIDGLMPAGGVDNVSDVDAGALYGIAVVANDPSGTGYYSLDGGAVWYPIGAVSSSAARLLAANASTRLYFQPSANVNGVISSAFTFRAWDQTNGTNGGTASTTVNGSATAFSTATDAISLTITAVNDAPTATNLSASETYTEDTPLNLVDIVSADVDNTSLTATLTLSNPAAGSLSTATSGAVTSTFAAGVWTASGAITDVNTLLSGLVFVPSTGYYDNFTVTTNVSDGIAAPVSGVKTFTGIHVVRDVDGDGYTTADGDCDDTNATVHPFAVELCNAVDDDCDGTVDNNAVDAALWFLDFDSDGFGDAFVSVSSCNRPSGYTSDNTDCDDSDINKWQTSTLFVDADTDGYDNGVAVVCYGISAPPGYSLTSLGSDCNDNNNTVHSAPAVPSAITGPVGACRGQSNVVFSVSPVQDATSYEWTLPAGATGNSSSNSISINFNNTFSGGNICVSAVNSCTSPNVCSSIVWYSVKPVKPSAISGANKVCPNSSEVYSIAAVPNATYYQWTAPANGVIASGQGTTTVTVNYNNAFTSGTLQVAASNCIGTSAAKTLSISLKNAPARPSAIAGASSACRNSQVVYSVNPVLNANSYQWTAPANATIVAGQGTTTATVEFGSGFTGGTLSVYAVGCGGNSSSRTKTISRKTTGCGSGKTDEEESVSDLESLTQLTEDEFNAVVYPNPFGNEFTLKLSGTSASETEIKIINATGQLVKELHEKSTSEEIKLGVDLPQGMYFICITNGNKFKTLRIIKSH